MKYSFCEGVWAGPRSVWHIRKRADDQPLMHGGGVQTGSMCGRVEPGKGWDLETTPTIANYDDAHVCVHCTTLYRKERVSIDIEANKDSSDLSTKARCATCKRDEHGGQCDQACKACGYDPKR